MSAAYDANRRSVEMMTEMIYAALPPLRSDAQTKQFLS